jgi:hypothetical protein
MPSLALPPSPETSSNLLPGVNLDEVNFLNRAFNNSPGSGSIANSTIVPDLDTVAIVPYSPTTQKEKNSKNPQASSTVNEASKSQDTSSHSGVNTESDTDYAKRQVVFNRALSSDPSSISGALKILGLGTDFSNEKEFSKAVESAWRKAARLVHPDANTRIGSEEQRTEASQNVNVARDTLNEAGYGGVTDFVAKSRAEVSKESKQKNSTSATSSPRTERARTPTYGHSRAYSDRKNTATHKVDPRYRGSRVNRDPYSATGSRNVPKEDSFSRINNFFIGLNSADTVVDLLKNKPLNQALSSIEKYATNLKNKYGEGSVVNPKLPQSIREGIGSNLDLVKEVYSKIDELRGLDNSKAQDFINSLERTGLFTEKSISYFKEFAHKGTITKSGTSFEDSTHSLASDIVAFDKEWDRAQGATTGYAREPRRQWQSSEQTSKTQSRRERAEPTTSSYENDVASTPHSRMQDKYLESFCNFVIKCDFLPTNARVGLVTAVLLNSEAYQTKAPEQQQEFIAKIFNDKALGLAGEFSSNKGLQQVIAKKYGDLEDIHSKLTIKLGINSEHETITGSLLTQYPPLDQGTFEAVRGLAYASAHPAQAKQTEHAVA